MPAPEYHFLADGFVKSFGSTSVLRSAAVWARSGSITVLLGRNGCGKSTLLKCALGIYGGHGGVTRVGDDAFHRPTLWRLARLGLFYWPDHDLLSRRRSLGWHFDLLDDAFDRGGADRSSPIREAQSGVTASLSGGERTLAEFSVVKARRPTTLIADEPLAGLDPRVRTAVADGLRGLADAGAAIVLTGHDAGALLDLADEVVWMARGSTYALGDPQAARRHHQFRREYLGFSGAR